MANVLPEKYKLIRSFGRRRARALSPRQQQLLRDVLPRVELDLALPPPASAPEIFGGNLSEFWLEIGFGGGEHLIWQAENNPSVGVIGCEPFIDGVVKTLSAIETQSLCNIRLYADDARDVLGWLREHSISKAFMLFPDPWPKLRHHKRRLLNSSLLDQMARVLAPSARFRIATDIGDYARAILIAVHAHPSFEWRVRSPADWRYRPPDWPRTRYEEKAIREGRTPYFFEFVRVG